MVGKQVEFRGPVRIHGPVEIAESAQRADSGSSDAASSVAKVVEFTHQTDEISKSVLSAAQEKADRHEAWKEEFESFVQTMRAS